MSLDPQQSPSWILDWRDYITIAPFPKVMELEEPTSGETLFRRVYNAGGTDPVRAMIDGQSLVVDGCSVDLIEELSDFWIDMNDPSIIKDWKPTNSPGMYPTGESFSAALLRAVIADVKIDQDDKISQRNHAMDWAYYDSPQDQLSGAQIWHKDRFRVALNKASFGSRLSWTQKGYLGVVPAASEVGDGICAFFGAQVLYVMRKKEENKGHDFMGECYMRGLMDGETLSWVRDGRVSKQKFKLV